MLGKNILINNQELDVFCQLYAQVAQYLVKPRQTQMQHETNKVQPFKQAYTFKLRPTLALINLHKGEGP